MEETAQVPPPMGSKHLNLKKSFKVATRSLLTACPYEDFSKAFAGFTTSEQDGLYRMFIQVISSLYENLEDEFESLCLETQVGSKLDTVEQLVEEQSLDPLYFRKSSVGSIKQDLSAMKKNEIQILQSLLEKAEVEKQQTEARIELLQKKMENVSSTSDAVKKLNSMIRKLSDK